MPCSDPHCPFLNRDDERCAEHFQLTHLQHAFRHCLSDYKSCPAYKEMLLERRVRQVQAKHAHANVEIRGVTLTVAGQAYAS